MQPADGLALLLYMEFKPFKQGKYVLLERLASGGMAEVYRAKADGAGGFVKQLAVKRILPNYSQNDEFQKMFEYEARLSSQLTHANIVQIYDFVQSGDVYLLAMEFVDGKNLRQFINKAKKIGLTPPIPFTVYTINEAAKGLDYAHKKKDDLNGRPLNIIHRDMSPQNIMLSYEGSAKIVDFGIAKAKDKVDETRSGVIKGKFGYMSPEQANGDAVDARSDVFSTVIILWEMLTGRRLFTAENDLATLKMIQECQITPPSKHNPNVKPDLERIVMKGLAKDVSLRYSDAGSLSRDLQSFLARYYPTFSQKDVSDTLQRAFKEEIALEKKRWEEALRKSITFSQGASVDRPEDLSDEDGDVTRSETGAVTLVTSASELEAPVEGSGKSQSTAPKPDQALMDFEQASALDPSMMALDEAPSGETIPKVASQVLQPPQPPKRSSSPPPARDEDRTMVSDDEIVTPSPFAGAVSKSSIHMTPVSNLKSISERKVGSEAPRPSAAPSVSDPEVMLPGQASARGSLSQITEADLKVRDPDMTTGRSESVGPKPSMGERFPKRDRSSRPKQNVYLDDLVSTGPKSKWPMVLAVASVLLFMGGGGLLYQQGGLPALIKRFSERSPAKSQPPPPGQPPDGSFKATTTTADENARNENQCILKADSDPRGATVTVNKGTAGDKKQGATPTTFVLPCGATKVVTVELAGYQTVSDNVVITKRTDEKYWTLRRIPKGIVRLILSQNANVWVNGQFVKYLAAREAFEIELSARKGHKFEFKNDVLGVDQSREIDVEPDVTREERVSLEEKVKR